EIVYRNGQLRVDPAPLVVRAQDAFRPLHQANPAFRADFDGFVLGEGLGDLRGRLVFSTTAGPGSLTGLYPLLPSGLSSANYAISYQPGRLFVLPLSGTELLRTAEHADAEEDRLLRGDPSDQGDRDFDVYYESRAYSGAVFSLGAGGEEEE